MYLKNKFASVLVLGGMVLLIASCTKKLDTNLSNPNSITTNAITGKDVFANALQNTVYAINANAYIYSSASVTPVQTTVGISTLTNEWMGIWARTTSYSASGTQYLLESFILNNGYGDNFWGSIYHNLSDYNFVASKSAEGSILPGASLVMKALLFQDLVDIFGNVPYSQALTTNTTPAYDAATAIYASLPPLLDSAMGLINASQATGDDAADIMFKGNKASWLAFANTVKLRVLLRQIPNASSASALKSEMDRTTSYGFMTPGVDATINPGYKDAINMQSPFWATFGFQVGGVNPYQPGTFFIANQTMIDYLTATSDPRLGAIYTVAPAGGYAGNYLGDADNAKLVSHLSSIGSGILKSASMDGVIMTASEGLFLQAEAAQRGLITGNYLDLFGQGVAESFRFLGVSASAASYISGSTDDRVNPAVAADPIKTIIYQKWVANAEIDGLEIWSDYRRTGYPDRTNPSVNPAASVNVIPKRLLYPLSETAQNTANYNAQHQQNSDIYTKIFWGQ